MVIKTLSRRKIVAIALFLLFIPLGYVAFLLLNSSKPSSNKDTAADSSYSVITDRIKDWEIRFSDREPLELDFADIKNVSLKVDGETLLLKYDFMGLIPSDSNKLKNMGGQEFTNIIICSTIYKSEEDEESEEKDILGRMCAYFFPTTAPDSNKIVEEFYFDYNYSSSDKNQYVSQDKIKIEKLNGGVGFDFFEVGIPLSLVSINDNDIIAINGQIEVFGSNSEVISGDILENASVNTNTDKIYIQLGTKDPINRNNSSATDYYSTVWNKDCHLKEPIKGPEVNDFNRDPFRGFAISISNPNHIYYGTELSGIFKSTDGGKSFKWAKKGLCYVDVDSEAMGYPETYHILTLSTNDNTLFVAGGSDGSVDKPWVIGGVYRSTDAGSTWHRKTKGIKHAGINSIAEDKQTGHLYTITGGGLAPRSGWTPDEEENAREMLSELYISKDLGESWKLISQPMNKKEQGYSGLIIRDGKLYLTGVQYGYDSKLGRNRIFEEDSVGLIVSEDGGYTWVQLMEDQFVNSFDVSISSPNVMYANYQKGIGQGQKGIQKSIDGGKTWKYIPITKYGARSLIISPIDHNTLLFSDGKDIYKSSDGMISARKVHTADDVVNDIVFSSSNPKIIYAITHNYHLSRSEDGGNTFEKLPSLSNYFSDKYK
jgi:hypothetical protein